MSAAGATNSDMADRQATPSQETLSPSGELWALLTMLEGPKRTQLQI